MNMCFSFFRQDKTKTMTTTKELKKKVALNLQLSILCSIMKWGPSPVILDDL